MSDLAFEKISGLGKAHSILTALSSMSLSGSVGHHLIKPALAVLLH